MTENSHNTLLSIAVDNALLKLSKEHGIALPKDDPILAQIYLSREINAALAAVYQKDLEEETTKIKRFFKDALVTVAREHNKQMKSLRFLALVCAVTALCSCGFSVFVGVLSMTQ